jgi:L-fucose mutarotase
MLNGSLVHPEILRILATSGHHSKVLIADGNYPAANKRGPRAELVSLQLMPGVPTVAQVFEALLGAVRIDEVFTWVSIEPTPMPRRLPATRRSGPTIAGFSPP